MTDPAALRRQTPPQPQALSQLLIDIYQRMYNHFGDRHWWPAETAEEVIIGAILVQSVSWSNTVRAMERLRTENLLSLAAIHRADPIDIERCIVSTRYYRSKTRKLKAFADHVQAQYGGHIDHMLQKPLQPLRSELLSIYGIGPETADAILLYAAGHPSFVVDAYTKRIFSRIGLISADVDYESLRAWFMAALPAETALYNQYHALLDGVGHHFCHITRPSCGSCPLAALCEHARSNPPNLT